MSYASSSFLRPDSVTNSRPPSADGSDVDAASSLASIVNPALLLLQGRCETEYRVEWDDEVIVLVVANIGVPPRSVDATRCQRNMYVFCVLLYFSLISIFQ
eukprot:PhM_4_TR8224/c0_g1_i1/m.5821